MVAFDLSIWDGSMNYYGLLDLDRKRTKMEGPQASWPLDETGAARLQGQAGCGWLLVPRQGTGR